ncbi:MAG: hypothetical protein IT174_08925 [Acidobacteria bacterium]|nr:hypothetical protein [Acidobacteriota bacterium]
MQTLTIKIILILAVVSCVDVFSSEMQTEKRRFGKVDGTYVFISETTVPERGERTIREGPEWKGIYIFQDGVYSISLIRESRNDDWVAAFPKDYQALGYESEAGIYQVDGTHLKLEPKVSLHPFGYQAREFILQLDEDGMILKSKTPTHSKRVPSGDIVIVLRPATRNKFTSL